MGMVLCEDGVVRRGAMHHGTDYPCTAHAHYAGEHIECLSPSHAAPHAVVNIVDGTGSIVATVTAS